MLRDSLRAGRLLIKAGGLLLVVVGVLKALKYIGLLFLLYVLGDSLLLTLGWVSPIVAELIGLFKTSGYALAAFGVLVNLFLAYIGYRLLRLADHAPLPSSARDRWLLTLALLLALAILLKSTLLLIATTIPLLGLIILPTNEQTVATAGYVRAA